MPFLICESSQESIILFTSICPCHWVYFSMLGIAIVAGGQPAHDASRTSCWLLAIVSTRTIFFAASQPIDILFYTPYCEDKLSSTVGNFLSILIGSEAGKLYTWPQLRRLSPASCPVVFLFPQSCPSESSAFPDYFFSFFSFSSFSG